MQNRKVPMQKLCNWQFSVRNVIADNKNLIVKLKDLNKIVLYIPNSWDFYSSAIILLHNNIWCLIR